MQSSLLQLCDAWVEEKGLLGRKWFLCAALVLLVECACLLIARMTWLFGEKFLCFSFGAYLETELELN